MNTTQLKYFLSAAKHLSFSETAKEFYMTQPAISHQISDLEQELGTKLFNRTARGVSLTKSGAIFLDDAKRFLDLEYFSRERLRNAQVLKDDHLSIAYLASPCKYFLPKVISDFHRQYPQIEITLKRLDALGAISSLEQETFDIYFSLMEDLKHQKHYHTRKIHEDHYCLICRSNHPCLQSLKIDYEKIATEPFLMFEPEKAAYMSRQITQVCKDLNFTPRVVNTYPSMEEVLFAVESGLGISILPGKTRDYFSASLTYVPLDSSNTACAMGVAWRSEADDDRPAIQWFINALNQHFVRLSTK